MSRESCEIESNGGVILDARIYRPENDDESDQPDGKLIAVLVHPYSVLGGFQGLMKGIAIGLAQGGLTALTFNMRGVGNSTGRPSLTGFAEVDDVVSVCNWASQNLSARRILLVGSSAGAAIAGSAVDRIEQVVGYVSIGYPFGLTASILFGRHHKGILQSPKPKLFVMGTKDGFTSVKQLETKLKNAAGHNQMHLIQGASHFQMEGPAFDAHIINLILQFIKTF